MVEFIQKSPFETLATILPIESQTKKTTSELHENQNIERPHQRYCWALGPS